jgi:hypothetical protein
MITKALHCTGSAELDQQIHTILSYLFKIYFNIIFQLYLGLPSDLFPSRVGLDDMNIFELTVTRNLARQSSCP